MEERLRDAARNFIELDNSLAQLEVQKAELQRRQAVYQTAIHMAMRELGVDVMNVGNTRFSRAVKGQKPRRAAVKDVQLVDVLKKHLGGSEDNKLRSVLEDIAQLRNPHPSGEPPETHEVLMRRTIKERKPRQ